MYKAADMGSLCVISCVQSTRYFSIDAASFDCFYSQTQHTVCQSCFVRHDYSIRIQIKSIYLIKLLKPSLYTDKISNSLCLQVQQTFNGGLEEYSGEIIR